jgi:TRAP-type C4-dicarboxylate transport system permease small subunit|tara:strand:+ start:1061 stop:1624 length:564 start_codon:yes stop_codon:yes gene_type:complete
VSDTPEITDDTSKGNAVANLLRRLTDGTSSLFLFAMMVMTCIDVVGRYAFNSPLDGATELTELFMGILIFAVLPTVSFREEHVSVDLMDLWFPVRLINTRQLLINLLAMGMMATVAWRMWIFAVKAVDYGDATEYLAIQYAPIYFFISLTCAATSIALLLNIPRYIKGQGPLSPGHDETGHDDLKLT